jgi:transposase-like protein
MQVPPVTVAEAEEDILAYVSFPPEQWTRIYSTSPLERLNQEVNRRTNVVGVFPDEAAVVRLIGAMLLEQAGEPDEHDDKLHHLTRRSFSRNVLSPAGSLWSSG